MADLLAEHRDAVRRLAVSTGLPNRQHPTRCAGIVEAQGIHARPTLIPRAQYMSLLRFLSGFSGLRGSQKRLNPLESTCRNGPNPPFRKPFRIKHLRADRDVFRGARVSDTCPRSNGVPTPPFWPRKPLSYGGLILTWKNTLLLVRVQLAAFENLLLPVRPRRYGHSDVRQHGPPPNLSTALICSRVTRNHSFAAPRTTYTTVSGGSRQD
jgi:hypothetical protein